MDEQSAPRIFDALRRYRTSSLVIVLVAVVLSVAVAFLANHQSTVTARIVLKMPEKAGITGTDAPSESTFVRYVKQRALFVTSDRVLGDTKARLHLSEPVDELRDAITVTASDTGESITVTASADTTAQASGIANAVISSYQDQSRAEQLSAATRALQTLGEQRAEVVRNIPDGPGGSTLSDAAAQTLSDLDTQSAQIRLSTSQFGNGVSFVDKASADDTGPLGGMARDAGIGLVLGVLLAGAVAWFRADRDRRVREFDDLGEADEPLLGEIEVLTGQQRLGLHDLSAPPLRSYRFAASGLRTVVGRGVVVVTGTALGDGSTTTTLQLASAAARDGARVLVVDSVLRSHELSDILGLDHDPEGLTALAGGATSLQECARAVYLGQDIVFWAVPAGRNAERARDHLQSTMLERSIMEMRSQYDLVLVDSAPLTGAPEITPIIRQSDGVVVVVRRNSKVRSLSKLREQLKLFGGTIAGYVFTFAGQGGSLPSEPESPTYAQRYQ
jgi:Mrp family chromosome partitioning ATPase/capsular polysaccharide biosynthesis protein